MSRASGGCADIVDIMRRMKLLGFNAIRMPFSMQDLYHATPRDFHWQYCTNVDGPTFLKSVTNPHVAPPAGVSLHANCKRRLLMSTITLTSALKRCLGNASGCQAQKLTELHEACRAGHCGHVQPAGEHASCATAGFDTSKLNLTLPYEPLGARPFIPLTNPFILPSDAGTCNLGLPNLPRVRQALRDPLDCDAHA